MTVVLSDADLANAFLGQDDRTTHSGLLLSECFSRNQFNLVFTYGTVMQRSAVRQALIACLSLPPFDARLAPPARNATFERHLENLVLHALRSMTSDLRIPEPDRIAAKLLVEAASMRHAHEFDVPSEGPAGTEQARQDFQA
jgi:hypothetical protein